MKIADGECAEGSVVLHYATSECVVRDLKSILMVLKLVRNKWFLTTENGYRATCYGPIDLSKFSSKFLNEIIGDLEEFLNPKPDESGCDEIEIAINALCDSNCDNPCNDNDSDFDDE